MVSLALLLAGFGALAAFAPAIASIFIGGLLSVLSRVGCFANISVDPHTQISIQVHAVQIAFWSSVWGYLRSPARAALVAVRVPAIHLSLVLLERDDEIPESESSLKESCNIADAGIALRDLRHPMWEPVARWLAQLHTFCYIASMVALSFESISIDVVAEADKKRRPLARIQDGSIDISLCFKPRSGQLTVDIDVARNDPTKVLLPDLAGSVQVNTTRLEMAIPIPSLQSNHRAPFPESVVLSFGSVVAKLDLCQMVRAVAMQDDLALPDRTAATQAPIGAFKQASELFRLFESIPSIRCQFALIRIELETLCVAETCALSINNFDVHLSDAVESAVIQHAALGDGNRVEKAVSIGVGVVQVQIENQIDGLVPCSISHLAKVQRTQVDVDLKVALDLSGDDKDDTLSCCVTVSGECRGVSVGVSDKIRPWIQAIDSELQSCGPILRSSSQSTSLPPNVEIEIETQLKVVHVELLLVSLSDTCEILPDGVPSICLSIDEVNMYSHPFVGDEHMGIRSKTDLQFSRLKLWYITKEGSTKSLFLSLDFTRVFISPVAFGGTDPKLGEVEMEAEWLELKWAPQVLHCVGGMLELLLLLVGPMVLRSKSTVDQALTGRGLAANVRQFVSPMKSMQDVVSDVIADVTERIAFRCSIKRVCATFVHEFEREQFVDCLTANSCRMSVEETAGRFRISVEQIKVFRVQSGRSRDKGGVASIPIEGVFHSRSPPRRRSSAFKSKAVLLRRSSGSDDVESTTFGARQPKRYEHYFYCACFALEETKVQNGENGVIDMFADDVRLEWAVPVQLRVMELVRKITIASWEMLYRTRAAYARYCTPIDSVYNRPFGLNPPMSDTDECARWEAKLKHIISGSGGKLHRMSATRIRINAPLTDSISVVANIGFFGGDDLPDLWRFSGITVAVNDLTMLQAESICIRRTVDKRADYVYGEFEMMLRERMRMTGRLGDLDKMGTDGMLVECTGVVVRTSVDFQFCQHLATLQAFFAPFADSASAAMTRNWRPDFDCFYNYFLRTPLNQGPTKLWIGCHDLSFQCVGNKLESWLEQIYPIWIEELEQQELRMQIIEEQITALKLRSPEMLLDESQQGLLRLLAEKNAKIYIQKVQKLFAANWSSHASSERQEAVPTALMCAMIKNLSGDVTLVSDTAKLWQRILKIDGSVDVMHKAFQSAGHEFERYSPSHLFLCGAEVNIVVSDVAVQMRRFLTPLLHCESVVAAGTAIAAAWSPGATLDSSRSMFDITGAVRCFSDLSLALKSPLAYFCPCYVHPLKELGRLAQNLGPLVIPSIDKRFETSPWDIARRVLHGKIRVDISDAAVRLLSSSTSFELSDYLGLSIQKFSMAYANDNVDLDISHIAVKIEPWALSNCVEISALKLVVWLKWLSKGKPPTHYVYPIEFCRSDMTSTSVDTLILDPVRLRLFRPSDDFAVHVEDLSDYAERALKSFAADSLSMFIQGSVGRACENATADSSTGKVRRETPGLTAIVLYAKHIEWFIQFGKLYYNFMQQVFHCPANTSHDNMIGSKTVASFETIFVGCTVEEFDIVGLDVALYSSEKHPVGVRVVINDRFSGSGAFLHRRHELFQAEAEAKEQSTSVRRLYLPSEREEMWVAHDVFVIAQGIQVRVCSTESGSRGEPLVHVKEVTLTAGGGTEPIPTHDNRPLVRTAMTHPHLDVEQAGVPAQQPEEPRRPGAKNILEHFSILQENPFRFRDSEDDSGVPAASAPGGNLRSVQPRGFDAFKCKGFLLGLSSQEARILITFHTLETLIDIAEDWLTLITVHCPDLLMPKLPSEDGRGDTVTVVDGDDGSPRKPTSLAEDPKFGRIFEQFAKVSDAAPVVHNKPAHDAQTDPAHSTTASNPDALQPSEAVPPNAIDMLVDSFFVVQFVDCQISIHDQDRKGCVLLAMSRGTLQNSISADHVREYIDLHVEGLQMFTAPLDIDVKSRTIWLKALSDSSYCPISSGLFKGVIAPVPAMLTVWIDRTSPPTIMNKVKLHIPSIEVTVHIASKDILQNLITGVIGLVTAKLTPKKSLESTQMFASLVNGGPEQAHRSFRSIQELDELRRQLRWKIAYLQWQQKCRWNHYVTERSSVAFTAAERTRMLPFEVETSPLFQRQLVASSASSISMAMSFGGGSTTATAYGEVEQISDDLERTRQQYDMLSELVASMAKKEQQKTSVQPNTDFEFALERAVLALSSENADIVQVSLALLHLVTKQYEDRSGTCALTLSELSARNLTPGTSFPDLLQARSLGIDDMFLRMDAEMGTPVGGITIVKHFEVNVHPIQVCITQDIILQLVAYFSPTRAAVDTREDQKRRQVRSQFLTPYGTGGTSSDGLVGAASKIKKAVRVAGKAAAHPLSMGRSAATCEEVESDDNGQAGHRRTSSRALQNLQDDAVEWMSKIAFEPDANSVQSGSRSEDNTTAASSQNVDTSSDRNASETKDRGKNNITFKRIRLGTVDVVVTYKNKKTATMSTSGHQAAPPPPQALEDMRGFEIKIHPLVYCDKTCSPTDLLLRIRRDIVLDVLSQVGRNFTNIGNFLRDQFDLSRWAKLDALAPLRSLAAIAPSVHGSTAVAPLNLTSLSPTGDAVSPTNAGVIEAPRSVGKLDRQGSTNSGHRGFQLELPENHPSLRKKHASGNIAATIVRPSELLPRSPRGHSSADVASPPGDADGENHKPAKAKKSLSNLFTKRKSISRPSDSGQ